jgi:hypothetical protein
LERQFSDNLSVLLSVIAAVAYRERHDNNQQQTEAASQDFIFYVTVKEISICAVTPCRLVEIY